MIAVQLMSKTTSMALQHLESRGFSGAETENTSKFIRLVDSWFDLFSSRRPKDIKLSRDAYGLNLMEQNKILNEMMSTAKSLTVNGKTYLYPFQKGLIVSCQSVFQLYEMLQERYDINYIMTYRLNQDVLEHFFACLKQMGGSYEHPSPGQVKQTSRVRSYLLGKNCELTGMNSNTEKAQNGTGITEASFSEMKSCQFEKA